MKEAMSKMTPEMMKKCMESMGSEEMMKTAQEAMPEMMEGCLGSVNKEERKKMFGLCHTMMEEMKEKFCSE